MAKHLMEYLTKYEGTSKADVDLIKQNQQQAEQLHTNLLQMIADESSNIEQYVEDEISPTEILNLLTKDQGKLVRAAKSTTVWPTIKLLLQQQLTPEITRVLIQKYDNILVDTADKQYPDYLEIRQQIEEFIQILQDLDE
jgi:hypothetical protein